MILNNISNMKYADEILGINKQMDNERFIFHHEIGIG